MITARTPNQSHALKRLEERAARLAAAHAEEKRRSRRADPVRWRIPRLLWPLITGDK
jgi:hypothetical protein